MSLESAIDRMCERQAVTPVTPPGPAGVTKKTVSNQRSDPGDPGDPEKTVTPSYKPEAEASNQGGDVQRVWYVHVQGRTFPMIQPGGMTRAEAETAARARWPDAQVLAEEPRAGA